ncbi:hypothetical protein THASP1DRAFT_28935 [Thamnocephalis sphaerospora]|uniref:DUF4604 domain-containing protein n=1 Tax=Thamnocephalis sphaerospora TaxID=78915 RepID=A0A4P9XSX9_9FUNG|nr:hypothetical protein THASP1DRAFT_28935 [Thamnocephalis sphaerospora]|eukprot:RKP09258.1 hypothetical protein THASP1DRAFT_28935 [Thamnocephalis sphaerospora]
MNDRGNKSSSGRSQPNRRQLNQLTYTAETPNFLRNLVGSLPNARSKLPSTLLGHLPTDEGAQMTGTADKRGARHGRGGQDDDTEELGFADEWRGPEEERPQVVVLRKEKHLSQREVERVLGKDQTADSQEGGK